MATLNIATLDVVAAVKRDQARTRLARAAVVDAARALFLERSYGATTIDAISDRADVPAATVYRLFSSKLGILRALLDVTIAGDDQDVPVAERPQVRTLLEESDAHRQVAGFVAHAARINERVAPLYRILVSAAEIDPEIAKVLDDLTGQRQRGQRTIARSLSTTGSLRPGLRERDAGDIIHALLSPELYRLLVVDRGWNVRRYQDWVTALAVDQLLAVPAGRARPGRNDRR